MKQFRNEQIVLAQDAAKQAELFNFAYSSPSSPVLPLAGVGEDQITRVSDPKKFAVALASDIAGTGNGGAVALDLSPFWLLSGGQMNLEDYRSMGGLARAAVRTSFGVAVAGGDASVDRPIPSSLVISISTRLLRANDPLALVKRNQDGSVVRFPDGTVVSGFAGCFLSEETTSIYVEGDRRREEVRRESAALGAAEASAAATRAYNAHVQPLVKAQHEACTKDQKAALQRHPSLDVGLGYRLTGDPGRLEGLEGSGTILWATFTSAVILKSDGPRRRQEGLFRARLAAHARVTIGEAFYDGAVRTGTSDSTLLVVGLESAVAERGESNFRWSLQGGWTRQDAASATDVEKNFGRFLGNAALKVAQGFWLTGALGRVQGRGVEDDTYLLAGIAFSPPARESGFVQAFGK
jgi:hypothetical protein